jgi:hypothetical protein
MDREKLKQHLARIASRATAALNVADSMTRNDVENAMMDTDSMEINELLDAWG